MADKPRMSDGELDAWLHDPDPPTRMLAQAAIDARKTITGLLGILLDAVYPCGDCDGTGTVHYMPDVMSGVRAQSRRCLICGETGYMIDESEAREAIEMARAIKARITKG